MGMKSAGLMKVSLTFGVVWSMIVSCPAGKGQREVVAELDHLIWRCVEGEVLRQFSRSGIRWKRLEYR